MLCQHLLWPSCCTPQDKIDAMAAQHPDRFKAFYVVDKPK